MYTFLKIVSSFIICILLFACSNPLAVDVSKSKYTLNTERIDDLFTHANEAETVSEISHIYPKYPDFMEYLLYYCYKTGMPTDSVFSKNWDGLKKNSYFLRLSKQIKETFPSTDAFSQEIEDGFKRLNVHLPQAKLPKSLIYFNSFFSSSIYCTEKEVAVGLERYLGHKTKVIQELPPDVFYEWVKKAMEKEFLTRDALCGWIMTHICEPSKDKNNIESFIQWGKILYLTKAAFPEIEDRIILRYQADKYDWAIRNERNIWEYLVKENLLFKTSETDQANFLQEGPFTAGLPQKGADRLGQFIGYRIICSYMEQYPLTLQELIKIPYNTVLTEYEIND